LKKIAKARINDVPVSLRERISGITEMSGMNLTNEKTEGTDNKQIPLLDGQ